MQETEQERSVINGLTKCQRSNAIRNADSWVDVGFERWSRDIAGDRLMPFSENDRKEPGSSITTDAYD